MRDRERQVAVITGAASGIGSATARLLAREGYDIACLDRDEARLADLVAELGVRHRSFCLDVCDEAAVVSAFREIVAWRGRIDALATCAGVVDTTEWAKLSTERFLEVLNVNVLGTFLPIREAAAVMRPGSRICTVSSVAGIRGGGLAGTVAYAASKGGVISLTKTLARELGALGINVNGIAPAVVRTPMLDQTTTEPGQIERFRGMTALRREGGAQEAAEAIVWFLSKRASFITGTTLPVDGGLTML
ncbi:SDR family NAD(P)-dependent oxidoreductase [Trinickia fusca]|uniref:SDR family oxidoreductase n=1 Tax=Trinickia fusca TaxID=2419777 RepID=A0A494XE90_9BURK|nr:SDR family NAD(P)-dependent oxidoreductase [Trinickia fusca]RKP46796.1 SDR family oxidoreductase [Trinickia fusca]